MSKLYRGDQLYWRRKSEYPEKNNRPVGSHQQTISHNAVSSTPRLSGIYNASGDMHWLYR